MTLLIVGLVLFFAPHSVRIVADGWRTRTRERIGERVWKGLYSLAAIAGVVLIVWGYGNARADPVELWHPPIWTRHVAAVLTVPAFVLIVAAYVPGNRIKAWIGHPMVAGVKIWAFAHLISNGRLADIVLFGAFLVWAVLDYRAARRRDRADGVQYPVLGLGRDGAVLAIGIASWFVFARYLHAWLIGVQPFA
jgi:uncharacterized membrane protein